jgi:hypothetical protein
VAGAALLTALLLAILWVVGSGWTVAIVGPGAPSAVSFGLSPAVGAGALILVGTLASRAGVALDGGAAWLVAALTAGAGVVVARRTRQNGKATVPSGAPVDSPHG